MFNTSTFKKLLLVFALPFAANAQVADMVTVNSGYTNQTFYSMQNGTVSSVVNNDWDLAFQVSGFEATIAINSKNNVKLYDSYKSIADWSSMTAADTNGMTASEFFNNDAHIFAGAFNSTIDTSNAFDLGWGVYDFATHIVYGDSCYFIRLANGNVKKLFIESLANAVYTFHVADLDGSNEIVRQCTKATYAGKNFGYYSIQNDMFSDREPNKYTWDLCFQQYWSINPISYKVTGVLSNDSVQLVKAYPVNDVSTATDAGLTYTSDNNVIGYDWKTYDFNTNTYLIADSTVYFAIDRNAGVWKIIFTGFDGASTGNFYFTKEYLGTVGISETAAAVQSFGVYPNPAADHCNLVVSSGVNQNAQVVITDLAGKTVYSAKQELNSGINKIGINTSAFANGMYVASVITDNSKLKVKFVKQ